MNPRCTIHPERHRGFLWLRRRPAAVLVLTLGACLLDAAPAGWARFRGPNGSGVVEEARPPVVLDASSRAWRVSTPPGLSSPVISGGRIFLTGVEGGRLVTLAFALEDGRQLWRREAPAVLLEPVHAINSHATPTPCVDDERVYVYFGSFGLLCYSLDGREHWQKPLPPPKSLYGSAASPILYGDRLVLVLDNDANLPDSKLSQSRLVAFENATGELTWETARPLMRSGWSTPAIWERDDGDELIVLGSGRVCAYDPKTGEEKWFVGGFARETIVAPVFGDGLMFVASAMGGIADEKTDPEPLWQAMLYFDADGDRKIARSEVTGHFTFPLRPEVPPGHPGFGIPLSPDPTRRLEAQLRVFDGIDKDRDGQWTRDEFHANIGPRPFKPRFTAIRPGGRGNATDSHVAWELTRGIPEIPSPIHYRQRIYLVRNGGLLAAVNAADGRMLYQERLGADGQYSASPVIANQQLYLVSNKGVLSVVKCGERFELVYQHDLGEPAFVTPALDADTIYLRTTAHLQAFRAR